MAFADAFVQCMQQAGISAVDEASVPAADTLQRGLDYLKQQLDGLDATVKEAIDAATKDDAASALLGDAVDVDAAVRDLLVRFDEATGWPLTTLLEWSIYCLQQAQQSEGQATGG
jgi:hypothetical protein